MRAPDPNAPAGRAPSRDAPSESRTADGKKGKAAERRRPATSTSRSEGAVYLDSAQALAIFTDDVVLDHPQFHMTSDKLEVYFIKDGRQETSAREAIAKTASNRSPSPTLPPKAQPVDRPAPQSGDAKLKQAIATGQEGRHPEAG